MAPEVSRKIIPEPEEPEEEDFSDLGPNPTPQMIALKRKSLATKSTPTKKTTAIADNKKAVKSVPKIKPPLGYFPGEQNSKIFFIEADISKPNFNHEDFSRIPNKFLVDFSGVNFTFLHTPIEWTPNDIFKTIHSIQTLNKNAK